MSSGDSMEYIYDESDIVPQTKKQSALACAAEAVECLRKAAFFTGMVKKASLQSVKEGELRYIIEKCEILGKALSRIKERVELREVV